MEPTNNDHEVIISDKATKMLISHSRFLAEISPQAADELREKLIQTAKSLQYFPERNPFLSDALLAANKYRKMVIDKRYLLIYQVVDKTVFVEYVLDGRQDYRWLF